jgi:RecA/RadA recombinase
VLETGAVAAVAVLVQLVATPTARVQEMVAREQRQLSQGLFSHTPVEAVEEVVPIATRQLRADPVVMVVAEMAQRLPTPLQHACR